MHSILFVGEALDGPVGRPTIVDWTTNSSVNRALQIYGESIYESTALTPSSTGCAVNHDPWTAEASFIYFDGQYKSVPLPNLAIREGYTAFNFDSPPITDSTSGWVIYRKKPTNTDLTWALRRALDQNTLTPSRYDTCGLLRVVSSDAVRASLSVSTVDFTAISPGSSSNNIQLLIGVSGITIIPPPNISLKTVRYLFTQDGAEKTSSDYKYLYQLIEALQQDGLAGIIPITALNTSKSNNTAICWGFGTVYTGLYSLAGGDNGSAITVDDLYSALANVDVSDYEVVAFCGRYGREIFPDAEDNLLNVYQGFPFQVLCSSSGSDLNTPYASKDDSYEDRWQSSRFSLVNGTLEYGSLLSASGDLIPSYAVILTSKSSWHGFGSRAPIAGRFITENTEKEDLARVGVVTLDLNQNTPVIFKGTPTDTEISSVGIACLRGVCRGLFPALYDTIGNNTSEVLSEASTLLEKSLLQAKSNGCPIIDYVAQAVVVGQTLILTITLDIAGQIEAISAQVALPIGR